jgi:peptidoglycan/xylan/chitin deacetylase (PgdA/CDA1 family)
MRSLPTSHALRGRAVASLAKLPLDRALKLLGSWRGVLVLNHHRIGDRARTPWDRAMFSASTEELDRQLGTLARLAEVIGPEELEQAMRAAPGRRVLITFDDGYRDNYELALPLLRAHGLTASFFLTSGFLDDPRAAWWDEIAWMVRHAGGARRGARNRNDPDRPGPHHEAHQEARIATLLARYKACADGEHFLAELARELGSGRCDTGAAESQWMTWEMARELRAAGMSIGGHTVTHPVLAHLSRERQREEIVGCAQRLREELGEPMRWFAYPVGARDTFTATTAELLRECSVELAFSYYGGFAGPSRWSPLDVPRVHVDAALAPRLLLQISATRRSVSRSGSG